VNPVAVLLPQLDEERRTLLFWLVLLLLPVAGRILRAVLNRSQGPGTAQERARELRERRQTTQEQQRQREQEGGDLWRRLVLGEEAARPPEPPTPEPPPAPRRAARSEEARGDVIEEPRSLSVLGEVVEPGAAPEVSLESETEPAPLQALGEVTLARAALEPGVGELSVAQKRFARRDLRVAIVMAEIVGPPLALRGPERGLFSRPAAGSGAFAEKKHPGATRRAFPGAGNPAAPGGQGST
jgi:hypothetical protein